MKEIVLGILKGIKPECDFCGSDDFIKDEFLDSFDIMTLITDIETEFECVIDPMDVTADNFHSIDSICKLIDKSKQ